ncbi:MAG TPA: Xaa-Pro peptidase family protein [Gemmatimonadaceae bacterium]|jgi:Xaa-Pro dipeptidase|nr:Xaa-Pro peptidase family protein [Gemmatimonadaceae bacterium]
MERREFIQRGASLVGAAALTGMDARPALAQPATAGATRRPDPPPPISESERIARREKAQTLMKQLGISAMLIEPGANMLYFTGMEWGRSERLFALLLPQTGKGIVVSPAFEEQRGADQVGGRFEMRVWQEDQNPESIVAGVLRDWGASTGKLAVDGSARTFVYNALAAAAPGLQLATAEAITNGCRGVKTAHEIEIMRYANAITLDAYRSALKTLRVGMTQAELARNVSQEFARMGYQGGALVLFGESSAYPHGLPHPRSLEENQVVLIDGGTSVHGYQSDMTRTVVFGKPDPEAEKVFAILQDAQKRALAFAAPGKKCGEVDAVARKVVADAGYGPGYRTFTHRLGHGIGLEGHEWPYLVPGSEIVLQPGMTFSDEPGIYQYGKFGIRVEDILAITEDGAEMMTATQSSLVPASV